MNAFVLKCGAQLTCGDVDQDGDGYGDDLEGTWSCEAPEKTTLVAGDCDDTNSAIRPGAAEWCDSVDNDCDGLVDEDFSLESDSDHCGACNQACQDASVTEATCVDSACAVVLSPNPRG